MSGPDKSSIRQQGFRAIKAAGVLLHPECRTDEEVHWTVIFVRSGAGACERCGQSLAGPPQAADASQVDEVRP